MDVNQAIDIIKSVLPEKRFLHTLGVVKAAKQLANKYGGDINKVELSAIFHDYAKYRPVEEMRQIIIEQQLPKQLLNFHTELWHAPVGAYLVEREIGITDVEILNGIRYHTTGRPNMTLVEKIIYLADYIEPNRQFPGVDEVRQLAEKNINQAVLQATKNTIQFLLEKNSLVYPDTIDTYNNLINKS
ncbi:bis(5'-nucleosyl)-tetraphosphatase (symmetrical) YqeK [Bacillus kwashiorkori]|uniref:bis(5'-nucleosyl)-tetraphosphatase (symmetrical) YqeK n=1 Tax=Bacillus kwashiorkori TaxID=1522318 RepID=UPI000785F7D8|nr:bis(5'-nucleosyl)-tetraphosphatase (symmetrical) YqeK [Bacillus kwashiorkori]